MRRERPSDISFLTAADSSTTNNMASTQNGKEDDHDSHDCGGAPAPDAYADAFARGGKTRSDFFTLANGYVEPAEPQPPKAAAGTEGPDQAETKGGKRSRAFWFHNRQLTDAILLYGNQVTKLVDELPNAFRAHQKNDHSYRFEISKSKSQLLTLEVVLFNERTYLFLKKYFKPSFPAGSAADGSRPLMEVDEDSDWIPNRTVISFDPLKDDPQALLKFVLSAHRRRVSKP